MKQRHTWTPILRCPCLYQLYSNDGTKGKGQGVGQNYNDQGFLKPSKVVATQRMGKEINRVVYIRRINAIIVLFLFKTLHKVADRWALIDCGASENFIDIDTWKELKIGRFWLQKPITVYNVDRTKNSQGTLKYYCWLKVRIGEHKEKMMFFLTGLGKEWFILGYLFFWAFEPQIDWRKGQVLEGKISIKTISFRKAQDQLQEIQEKALKEHGRPAEGQALYIRKTMTLQKWAHQAKDAWTEEWARTYPESTNNTGESLMKHLLNDIHHNTAKTSE